MEAQDWLGCIGSMNAPPHESLRWTRDAMSDVQVTNARRIGFTALAVVSLWVMASGYTISTGFASDHDRVGAGLGSASVPTMLLWISKSGGRRWVLVCGLLFALSLAFVFWRAEVDASITPERHIVSWIRILPPLVLTTAFVILGAWRRAVRDADGHRKS